MHLYFIAVLLDFLKNEEIANLETCELIVLMFILFIL